MSDWLPDIVTMNDLGGDWDKYLSASYQAFCDGFVGQEIAFQGKRVSLKRHPVEAGKEATFWHMVSQGKTEADREIDLRRMERIGWLRAIIDNGPSTCFVMWTEEVRGEPRIHLWCEEEGYMFVLADRGTYVLPWTAYFVEHEHRRKRITRRAKQHLPPPQNG